MNMFIFKIAVYNFEARWRIMGGFLLRIRGYYVLWSSLHIWCRMIPTMLAFLWIRFVLHASLRVAWNPMIKIGLFALKKFSLARNLILLLARQCRWRPVFCKPRVDLRGGDIGSQRQRRIGFTVRQHEKVWFCGPHFVFLMFYDHPRQIWKQAVLVSKGAFFERYRQSARWERQTFSRLF